MTAQRTDGPLVGRPPGGATGRRSRRACASAGLLAALLAGVPSAGLAAPPPAVPTVQVEPGQGDPAVPGQPAVLANGPCLAAALAAQPGADGYEGRVGVAMAPGGGLASVRPLDPATPSQERAVQAAFAACAWPAAPAGGRALVVRVTPPPEDLSRRPAAAAEITPGPPPPPVALDGQSLKLGTPKAAGFRRPVPADEGCLYLRLRGRPKLAGLDNKVKFAVLRDGSVTQLSFLSPVEPEVEALVAEAFSACRWVPAADPQGVPLAVWVVLPLRIAGIPAVGEAP